MIRIFRACQIGKDKKYRRTSMYQGKHEELVEIERCHLFPTIVKGLLRVSVLFALEDGYKRGGFYIRN